jgi:hypothetical protein
MNRELIANKLTSIGMDPALTGFHYLLDMLELAPDVPTIGDGMCQLYEKVAQRHNTSSTAVERSMRHAVERFYEQNVCESPALCADMNKGKCVNKSFLYKLRVMLKEDSGHFSDGRAWVLRERNVDKYDVLVYVNGGCYTAFVGTHNACINFILNGGKVNAV